MLPEGGLSLAAASRCVDIRSDFWLCQPLKRFWGVGLRLPEGFGPLKGETRATRELNVSAWISPIGSVASSRPRLRAASTINDPLRSRRSTGVSETMKCGLVVGMIVMSLAAHLLIFSHRPLTCEGSGQSRSGRRRLEALILEQLKRMDRKLDRLHPSSEGHESGAALRKSLAGLKNELNMFKDDWGQNHEDSVQEGIYLSLDGEIPKRIDELSSKIEAIIGTADGKDEGNPMGSNRKKINTFIGVFTGFTDPGRIENPEEAQKYDYALRRKALRETWFPSNRKELDRLEQEKGIVIRFVLGHTKDRDQERKLYEEQLQHQDFLRLPILESYYGLANKTKSYFAAVIAVYDVDWVVKIDDDVYLIVDRLHLAQRQWREMSAGYIGCIKHGYVWEEEGSRWYEPKHLLIGKEYYLHAYGSIYVLPREVVENVIVKNFHNLRILANEDTTVGSWMLGHNVTYFEDMRLCAKRCSAAAIGILRNECAGLCNPLKDLYVVHQARSCQMETKDPLPYLPSYPDHIEFEEMRV